MGVGSVATAAPGFQVIIKFISSLPGGALMEMSVITGLLSAVTASASGALGIVIPTFGPQWVASGVSPEVVHRITAISSGAFSAMPHAGVVFAMMAVSGLKHIDVYRHIFFQGFLGHIFALIIACALSALY